MKCFGFLLLCFALCSTILGIFSFSNDFNPNLKTLAADLKSMILESYNQTHSLEETAYFGTQIDFWIDFINSPPQYLTQGFFLWLCLCQLFSVIIKFNQYIVVVSCSQLVCLFLFPYLTRQNAKSMEFYGMQKKQVLIFFKL